MIFKILMDTSVKIKLIHESKLSFLKKICSKNVSEFLSTDVFFDHFRVSSSRWPVSCTIFECEKTQKI